jgi:peptide-methionine (S)-S-oxide reductase
MAKVGFGGGCHWCTEGVFQALRGVTQVDQGFLQSMAPANTWAEGVIVTFDPTVIVSGAWRPPSSLCPDWLIGAQ